MTIDSATTLDSLNQAEKDIATFFDSGNGIVGAIYDLRANPWAEMGGDIAYWTEGYGLTSPDDDDYDHMEQEGQLRGTAKWVAGGFTMFVVYCDNTVETWIFDNAKRVECGG